MRLDEFHVGNDLRASGSFADTAPETVTTIAVACLLESRMALVALAGLVVSKPLHEMMKVGGEHVMVVNDFDSFHLPNVELGVVADKSEEEDVVVGNGTVKVIVKVRVDDGERLDPLSMAGAIRVEHGSFLFLWSAFVEEAVVRAQAHAMVLLEMPIRAVGLIELQFRRHFTNLVDETAKTEPSAVTAHDVGLGAHSDLRLAPGHEELGRSLKRLGLARVMLIDKAFFEPEC